MNKTLSINAPAKINLTLDILKKRSDGYHEVSMVMQSVKLHDRLTIEQLQEPRIVLRGDTAGVAVPEDNLIYKAAKLFLDTYDIRGGAQITLQKNIPIAAGLAGGSTDAAAVLKGLSTLYGLGLGIEELCRLAEQIGSDVPFCIIGGTMLAQGRGEKLTALPPAPPLPLVLVKPRISVSTAWVYKNYHKVQDSVIHPDSGAMQRALAAGDADAVCRSLGNVLEYVTVPAHPEIAHIKSALLNCGAKAAMMSGSGPTVFAVACSNAEAEAIAQKMRTRFEADIFATCMSGADSF